MNRYQLDSFIDRANKEKKDFVKILIATAIFAVLAHSFCYYNSTYSHDSLICLSSPDTTVKLWLGRLLHPINAMFRGHIGMSWLCGILSVFWLSVANYLLIKTFKFKINWISYLLCGLCVTSPAITFTNATFIYESDTYSLALLFACLALFITTQYRRGVWLAPVFICLSCCCYQAYFAVVLIGFMTIILDEILNNASLRIVLVKSVKLISCMLVGLLLYYAIIHLTWAAFHISHDVQRYNSVINIYPENSNYFSLLCSTYRDLLDRFWSPLCYHSSLVFLLNVTIAILSILGIAFLIKFRQINLAKVLLLLLLMLSMPLGINITYFLSKGLSHELMVFSYIFFYIISFIIARNVLHSLASEKFFIKFIAKVSGALVIIFITFSHIVYANHIYLQKSFANQSTMLLAGRILNDMLHVPEFSLGKTSVIFYGNLQQNNHPINRTKHVGFNHVRGFGILPNHVASYTGTLENYYRIILAVPINFADAETSKKYQENDSVQNMPSFPAAGYCKMVDNCLIVKLSEKK